MVLPPRLGGVVGEAIDRILRDRLGAAGAPGYGGRQQPDGSGSFKAVSLSVEHLLQERRGATGAPGYGGRHQQPDGSGSFKGVRLSVEHLLQERRGATGREGRPVELGYEDYEALPSASVGKPSSLGALGASIERVVQRLRSLEAWIGKEHGGDDDHHHRVVLGSYAIGGMGTSLSGISKLWSSILKPVVAHELSPGANGNTMMSLMLGSSVEMIFVAHRRIITETLKFFILGSCGVEKMKEIAYGRIVNSYNYFITV